MFQSIYLLYVQIKVVFVIKTVIAENINFMMFFDEDELVSHDLYHALRRELHAINGSLKIPPYGTRSVPTHTEDGIPIRKLYVSNLPPKTTRAELFGIFAQYGFIKSCWLRMNERGQNRIPTPTYAFVTYSNPEDAHKALTAPHHEKSLRGRHLRISPADSWHQPSEEADGCVRSKRNSRHDEATHSHSHDHIDQAAALSDIVDESHNADATSSETKEKDDVETPVEEMNTEETAYGILDILNRDCLMHILSYVPIRDLILSESVSKRWQSLIHEYLAGIRTFRTSVWSHVKVTLTTAVFRRMLMRVGPSLVRLHIDHPVSALNDRTAHMLGKFCPNLEELKVVGMNTKNWNPLIYGCKNLRNIQFISCNKLTDSSLVHILKSDLNIESLTVTNNTHVTGLFLAGNTVPKLNSLAFYNCYNLQGTVLSAAIDTLPTLTTLKVDVCPSTMWAIIPLILQKLPKLVELSLSEYTPGELFFTNQDVVDNEDLSKALATLTELKVLNLSRNINITNALLKQIAQSCSNLESLNISSCNSRKNISSRGVCDEGVMSVCTGCASLRRLDVSYLARLSDEGLRAAAHLPRLQALTARGCPAITAASLLHCITHCTRLQEVDVCGSEGVSEEVVGGAVELLQSHARPLPLRLYLAATGVSIDSFTDELPTHKMLTVDVTEDRSILHLRPDFVDRIFETSSDDSLENFYDQEDFDDFFDPDDELFMDDDLDMEDFDAAGFVYGFAPDIILI